MVWTGLYGVLKFSMQYSILSVINWEGLNRTSKWHCGTYCMLHMALWHYGTMTHAVTAAVICPQNCLRQIAWCTFYILHKIKFFCTGSPSLEATGIWPRFIVGIWTRFFRGPKFQTSGADGSQLSTCFLPSIHGGVFTKRVLELCFFLFLK